VSFQALARSGQWQFCDRESQNKGALKNIYVSIFLHVASSCCLSFDRTVTTFLCPAQLKFISSTAIICVFIGKSVKRALQEKNNCNLESPSQLKNVDHSLVPNFTLLVDYFIVNCKTTWSDQKTSLIRDICGKQTLQLKKQQLKDTVRTHVQLKHIYVLTSESDQHRNLVCNW